MHAALTLAVALAVGIAQGSPLPRDGSPRTATSPVAHPLSPRDIARAQLSRPAADSHVHGQTAREAFAKMNKFLDTVDVAKKPCAEMRLDELNDVTRTLYALRRPDLDVSYHVRNDRRKLHYEDLDYKEALWAGERALVEEQKLTHDELESIRGGKCAENVMMWIHHLTEGQRQALARSVDAFVLPYMPEDVSPKEARAPEYDQQIGCTSCHLPVHIPGTPPITPIPNKPSDAPQYVEFCPNDEATGLPKVWYNRTKRCDWDYSPFCEPCDGIGGTVWGNGEHEWRPMPCAPVARPEEVPVEQRMKPLWPKSFSVEEYASLTFPGRDPCAVHFKNSTYTLHFATTDKGPIYHTVGHTGPSGPIPTPGSSWATPDGNFWNTIERKDKDVFCVCLGSIDPVVKNSFTGPLTYDFDVGARYIGRERIIPEYLNTVFVADHYAKGPHHFWYDITTGLMIREWQPFNGLNIYYGWNTTAPAADIMTVPTLCYEGLTHANISCKAPPPPH